MIGSLLIAVSLALTAADVTPDPAAKDQAAQVRRYVEQLDAPQLARRTAAQEALSALGPDILPLLPQDDRRLPAETRERLKQIRQTLQNRAASKAFQPSRITLRRDGIPLAECLRLLSERSGNRIVNRRAKLDQAKTVSADFDQTPFWDALAAILDQTDLTVYPFGPERAVTLVTRQEGQIPFGRQGQTVGPFRILPIGMVAKRSLAIPTDAGLQLNLQVLWEPRLNPIRLRLPLNSLEAIDTHDRSWITESVSSGTLDATVDQNAPAVSLTIPLKLPPRDVSRLKTVSGKLNLLMPGRTETFRFDRLTDSKSISKQFAGVTVELQETRRDGPVWGVWILVRYDRPHDALESYLGWMLRNRAFLETADGEKIEPDSFETTRRTNREFGLVYRFRLENRPVDMTFVYETPGTIQEMTVDFQLEDLELP